DLPLHPPRDAHVVHEPDDVWPRIDRRGRAEWSVELFDHLRLALEDQDVRAPDRAHVEGLETRIQDQDLLHAAENVAQQTAPHAPARPGYRPIARSTASCSSGERATDALPRSSSFM